MGIPFVAGPAGMYAWLDLRRALPSPTWQGEDALVQALAAHKVLLTPGKAFHASEPGFFRLCFAYVPAAGLAEGLQRLGVVWHQATSSKRMLAS